VSPQPGRALGAGAAASTRFDAELGEFVLDWDDVRSAADPAGDALLFARSVFRHASALSGWDDVLTGSMDGVPPPLRPSRGIHLEGSRDDD
jgi:hypothetical protein